MKEILKNIIIIRRIYFFINFIYKNKYIPNFKKPKTYNEKINYRKKYWENKLFSKCSDKISCKEYVAEKIDKSIIIPNVYIGDHVSSEILKEIINEHGSVFVKANHNSGPVYLIESTEDPSFIESVCDDIEKQLKIDYGKLQNEPWYSQIKPKVLIEKKISPEAGLKDLNDYKFHVFTDSDGSQNVILHVDFDRSTNHNRSFFTEDLEWLPFSTLYPLIRTRVERPKNYARMLEIAKQLGKPFSYVRVDLYNVSGEIYFGELTFAHGSGAEVFSTYAHDLWMGNLWKGNPST